MPQPVFVPIGPDLKLQGLRRPVVHGSATLADIEVSVREAGAHVGLAAEVHISSIFARESFRHHPHVSPVAADVLCGFGPHGDVMVVEALARTVAA